MTAGKRGDGMAWLGELGRRLRFFGRSEEFHRELDEEMRTHLELKTRTHLQEGLAPDEARYAARREFGNPLLLREQSRDFWVHRWVEQFAADLRFGLRMLVVNPGFASVAVLTLALGIGVNSVIFSVISTMLLRKPPVHDPDRLMMLFSRNLGAGDVASRSPVSPPDFLDWRAEATSFSAITASSSFEDDAHVTLSGGSEPERVPGGEVSANYFEVLGVSPLLGRAFLPGEDRAGHDRVMVLRADLWKRSFGGDPRVLGRTVKVNGEAYTVIGVMPDTLRQLWMFPEQLWIPLTFTPAQLSAAGRAQRSLSVFGRLKPGASEVQARSELGTIARRIAATHPQSSKDWGANVLTLQEYAIQESSAGPALAFLMAAVGFVLLIACANLANLLLARNANRHREFAIRAALGAGRLRVVRQLLSECLLLALLGGGLGLLFATWGLHLLGRLFNWNEWSILIAEQLSIDGNVLLFTLAVSLVTAFVFGLAPAFQLSRRDPNSALKEGSRSTTAGREHHRLQNLLVAGQLALSLVLLVGAGLFVNNFIEEMRSKPGMNPHHVLTATISLTGKFYQDPAHQLAFFQGVLHRLADSPEVDSAAVTSDLPYTFPGRAHFLIEGRPASRRDSRDWRESFAGYFAVSPGYFHTTQTPLRAGREFTPADDASSNPVVIVNEAFARKFFSNGALGGYISLSPEGGPATAAELPNSQQASWRRIVGVVGDVNEYVGQTTWRPHVFVPFLQASDGSMDLVVRVRTDPAAFASSLRQAVWGVDKDQPVTNIRTMDRVLHDSGQGDDVMADLMGAFAVIALVMAAVGIYGLIGYLVGRRTHELGVRMALGARRREVLLLVLRGSTPMIVAGVGVGFLISLALPRLINASFQGWVSIHSGWILAGTPVAVLLVALASCYFPARRASEVEPTVALRCD
ncbi:MAG TPA: ABC transporter permease [Terriglobia bacterium]|nr:ABC transporter permease [Terriglobia bacterium]